MDTEIISARRNQTMLWVAVGCVAVLACGACTAILLTGGLVTLGFQTPDQAAVQISMPTQVQVGDTVEFNIQVDNVSTEPVELVGVDFSMDLLEGIVIESTNPRYESTNQFEGLDGVSWITYYFNQSIPAGSSLTVVFTASAVRAGDFSGNLDVCVDSDFTCVNNVTRIFIRE